jgi:predicted phage terminase large subunit-like protein
MLIVDDPIKANDANSDVALAGANDWFHNTALSRLDDRANSLVLITMQRLHVDDLSGILIEHGWPKLVLPAIAIGPADYELSDGKVYHRRAGELLQPDRDSMAEIEIVKKDFGSRIFSAQFQQNPTPAEGNQIKAAWLRRYDFVPGDRKFKHVVLACDPAGKAGLKNDYTAVTICGFDDKKEVYILHVVRGHWTVVEMQRQITALTLEWHVNRVIIEDTSSGMGLIQLLTELTDLNVIGIHPTVDKQTRMARHEGRFEAGRILLPREASWLADFESELLAFPGGRYDDQVDSVLLFLDWFSELHIDNFIAAMPISVDCGRPSWDMDWGSYREGPYN